MSDRVRELNHIAGVIQWAFSTLFHENEAVTTAVTAIHYMPKLAPLEREQSRSEIIPQWK
jgi:hypothetical protein